MFWIFYVQMVLSHAVCRLSLSLSNDIEHIQLHWQQNINQMSKAHTNTHSHPANAWITHKCKNNRDIYERETVLFFVVLRS